jgi:heterotetrameric sarcosine oxidase gamma subunit
VADIDGIGSTRPGHYGAQGTGVVLARATIGAAWNVQGDPRHAPFVAAAERQVGLAPVAQPNACARREGLLLLWLGPRSWLAIEGERTALTDADVARDALNAAGGALFDVSSSRVAFTLRGAKAADVLASGCPLDVDVRAFAPGTCAQSVFGHLNALIYRHDPATFTLMVATSFAADAWHALSVAAAVDGYDVVPAAPFRP